MDRNRVHADWDGIYREPTRDLGQCSPGHEGTQDLVHRHYLTACRFYTPSREALSMPYLFITDDPA